MIANKLWIALFSQTGSEIVNISKRLDVVPDIVLTNNLNSVAWSAHIASFNIHHDDHISLMNILRDGFNEPCFITLHGYLRILPDDICSQYEIYNGHPGLITKYPELKGINPQKKVADNLSRYSTIGSVVHEVIPEVDEGRVITQYTLKNDCLSEDDVFNTLKHTSLMAWINFFKEYIKCV